MHQPDLLPSAGLPGFWRKSEVQNQGFLWLPRSSSGWMPACWILTESGKSRSIAVIDGMTYCRNPCKARVYLRERTSNVSLRDDADQEDGQEDRFGHLKEPKCPQWCAKVALHSDR